MKRVSLKLIGIMSCLMILATLSIFGQEAQKKEFQTFNKKPLQDFALNLNQKLDSKEVDLDKPFSITLEGYLTKEGRFDVKRSKFTKSEGDEKMIAIGKMAIEAISDSFLFSYLRELGVEKVKVDLFQNDKNASLIIKSEMATSEKAKTISSGFNSLLRLATSNVKEDKDVKTLLEATSVNSQDNNFILNFALPKEEAHRLLKVELQKLKEKSYSSKGE